MLALGSVLRLGQFLIFAVNNHADPLALILYFVSLDTYFGVRTHPLYFLAKSRETVQVSIFVGKMNRNHIRLVLVRATQAAQGGTLQKCAALFAGHFVDFHKGSLWCSGLTESIANDLLSLANDYIQMRLVFETFGIDLVDVFRSGWPSREPTGLCNH